MFKTAVKSASRQLNTLFFPLLYTQVHTSFTSIAMLLRMSRSYTECHTTEWLCVVVNIVLQRVLYIILYIIHHIVYVYKQCCALYLLYPVLLDGKYVYIDCTICTNYIDCKHVCCLCCIMFGFILNCIVRYYCLHIWLSLLQC